MEQKKSNAEPQTDRQTQRQNEEQSRISFASCQFFVVDPNAAHRTVRRQTKWNYEHTHTRYDVVKGVNDIIQIISDHKHNHCRFRWYSTEVGTILVLRNWTARSSAGTWRAHLTYNNVFSRVSVGDRACRNEPSKTGRVDSPIMR